jgi:hypothetical protein
MTLAGFHTYTGWGGVILPHQACGAPDCGQCRPWGSYPDGTRIERADAHKGKERHRP